MNSCSKNDGLPKSIVLCLSHEVTDFSELSTDSAKRLDQACKIFLKHNCDLLITTGCQYKKNMKSTLAQLMASRAKKLHNIPEEKIFMETHSKDTVGEAVYVRKFLDEMNIASLKIVTSDWHTERAREIFSFVFWNQVSIIKFYSVKGSKKSRYKEKNNK